MKKLFLVSAVTSIMGALSITSVQAAPTLYGKAFVTADYVNSEADYDSRLDTPENRDEDSVQINSNFSRLGLKGTEALTDNTDVVYQLEYEIQVDGEDRTFQSRDTYLGLKNDNYGELRLGRNSSVFSYLYGPMLNRAYWDNLGKRTLNDTGGAAALNMLDYTRQSNSALWIAPEYNGLELILQYAADESFGDEGDEGYGAALKLDRGTGYTAAIAYSKDIEASGSIDSLDFITDENTEGSISYGGDAFRGAVTVDLDKYFAITTPITVGAVYQQADYEFAGSDKEKGLILSSKIGLNNFNRPAFMYIQYNKTDNLNGIDNNDSDQIVVGGEYEFKDNIIAHAYIGQNSADYTSPTDSTNSVADIKVFAAGAGIEYLF